MNCIVFGKDVSENKDFLSFLKKQQDGLEESSMTLHKKQLTALRESIIYVLETRLMETSTIQRDMQERRLQQNVDREEAISRMSQLATSTSTDNQQKLHINLSSLKRMIPNAIKSSVKAALPDKFRGTSAASSRNASPVREFAADEGRNAEPEIVLSENQRRLLETENTELLNELEGTLDLVR